MQSIASEMFDAVKRVDKVEAQRMMTEAALMQKHGVDCIQGTPWTSLFFLQDGTLWHTDLHAHGMVACSSMHASRTSWVGGHLTFDSGVAFKGRTSQVIISKQFKHVLHGSTGTCAGRYAITAVMDQRSLTSAKKCGLGDPKAKRQP